MNTTWAIEVQNVSKHYPGSSAPALRSVSLQIKDQEFFTLLGPSGCGKTTLLRMLAGFEATSSGHILLFGQDLTHLPPSQRPVNTVFQHYALFPHMTVAQNIAFGLRMLGQSTAEQQTRVQRMLQLVKMEAFADRLPTQLSGGQQQRVAFARALAPQPRVLLLDEPLSALDLKLRQAMRSELKSLQRETGITFIFVTHDQEEALSMSDRIAVLAEGRVQQVGSPADIYEQPANRFVADFIGESNLLQATVRASNTQNLLCQLADGSEILAAPDTHYQAGQAVTLSIRPEKIQLQPASDTSSRHQAKVLETAYLGTDIHYRLTLGQQQLQVRERSSQATLGRFQVNDAVQWQVPAGLARALPD